MATQQELRERITNQIIDALKNGTLPPWRRPWRLDRNSGFPANAVSKKGYRGINVLLLEAASLKHGFQSRWWGTFRQWSEASGKVMKRPAHVPEGQWGTGIVFWSRTTKKDTDEQGREVEREVFFMKTYHVFNADQVEGVDHLRVGSAADAGQPAGPCAAYERAEAAIAAAVTGAKTTLRFGGDRAFYSPEGDFIQVPHRETFTELDEFYETIFHEMVHATEHPSRLNWNRKDEGYAMGELIAELGACFLARELGVPCSENLTNHAAYLQSWLRAMSDDPRFIFTASSQASKAADYLLAFSQQSDAEPTPEPEAVAVG